MYTISNITNYNQFCYQIFYLILRTADFLEMAQVFYPIVAIFGRTLQILVFAIHRKDILRLLDEMQKFANLSMIPFFQNSFFI